MSSHEDILCKDILREDYLKVQGLHLGLSAIARGG